MSSAAELALKKKYALLRRKQVSSQARSWGRLAAPRAALRMPRAGTDASRHSPMALQEAAGGGAGGAPGALPPAAGLVRLPCSLRLGRS